jgi:predicted permease
MRAAINRAIAGLVALVRRRRVERDLDEELHAYLEAAIDENVRAGMPHEDAVRAARAQVGSLEAAKDWTRDAGWETRVESLLRDARLAVRGLRKSPVFALAAGLTLALGIGANTAIFSAVNAIMLRQLPVERPEELVGLAAVYPNGVEPVFSYAAYRRIASEAASQVDAIAASTVRREAITIDGPPEPVDVKWVSGNYFDMLGVPAALGRAILEADDRTPPGTPVAVLSHAYWTRRFGRDRAVLGRSLRLKNAAFTIVGVAPRGFSGESPGETLDLWLPMTTQPNAPAWIWEGHSTTWLRILARRRSGVTLDRARASLELVYGRIRDEVAAGTDSPEFRASVLGGRLAVAEASRGASRLRDNLSGPLVILMAIVGLVLLVACANVASLLLARAVTRRRETAVCLAIGAPRARLVRQGLLDALLLAAAGGLAGILLATWATSTLEALISGALPVSLDISPDARVLVFAACLTSVTALLFGAIPVLRMSRMDPLGALRAVGGARTATRIPLGRTLVVGQIAVSLVLLVLAGLFVRSLAGLRDIDTGFDPDGVVLFQVTPPVGEGPGSSATRSVYRRVLERAESVPGVEGVSGSFSGLFSQETWRNAIAIDGFEPPAGVVPRTFANAVTPGYFDVMRLALLQGRAFTGADHETAPKVAIVNDAFARQFFNGTDALGRRVGLCRSIPCSSSLAMLTVVGVAEDAKYTDLREDPRPMLYLPFAQVEQNLREIQVRASGPPDRIAAQLHRELAAVDTRLGVVGMVTARTQVDGSLVAERLIATLSATFGFVALGLALVGLYGLVACVTAQRSTEIGIRMALGAGRREVRGLVLRDTVRLLAAGIVVGLPAAIAAASLVRSQLYDVAPTDPWALLVALGTLVLAAVSAGYLPARRAARVDPAVTLRAD